MTPSPLHHRGGKGNRNTNSKRKRKRKREVKRKRMKKFLIPKEVEGMRGEKKKGKEVKRKKRNNAGLSEEEKMKNGK